LRVSRIEFADAIVDALLEEPLIAGELIQELLDGVLRASDRTSQKKNDLDNLFVFGDPSIERVAFILRPVLLAPVLHILSRFEDMSGCTVDGHLDFNHGRLQYGPGLLEPDLHLEEWLEHLLRSVAATADPLLHQVQ
jgi:hypothetical protein